MSFGTSEMIQKKPATQGAFHWFPLHVPRPVLSSPERRGEARRTHGTSSQVRKNKLAHWDSENTIIWGFSGNSNGSVGFLRSVVESLMGQNEKEMQGEREVEGKQALICLK